MLGFGGITNKRCGPIGVALSARDVRLVQRMAGGAYVFEQEWLARDVDPTSPAYHTEASRAVETAIRRGTFSGKQVVCALPADSLRYKTLRLPPMPPEEMAQAVAWEAAERLKVDADQAIQFYQAGEVRQGNEKREELVLLAVDKQVVHDYASAIQRAGLRPTAIDATGGALARLLGQPEQSALVIHLTEKTAEIIGVRGQDVIFDKPVALALEEDTIDLAPLAREISLCLRYLSVTFAIHKPQAAWLCGENASTAVADTLSQRLGLTVQTADQAPAMQSVAWDAVEAGRWAVAMGLANRLESAGKARGAA